VKKIGLVAIVAVCLLTGAGFGSAMSYGSDETLPPGFNVGGIPLGGQPPEAALETIRARIADLEGIKVSIDPESLGGSDRQDEASGGNAGIAALGLRELGLRIGAEEAVRAIERRRAYSWWERARLRAAGERGETFGITVSWDEDALKREAEAAWGTLVDEEGRDASRTIDDEDRVVYVPEKPRRRIDLSSVFEQIRGLEPDSLADEGGENVRLVRASVERFPPAITEAMLREEGIDRKIVEFSTSFATSGEGRSHNVTAAAMALNDTLLMPGEVFEYGKIVEKAEKEYGYMEAPVILKGKLTPGIGGGICQVSSTLYNAALLTGLEIVERRNHSLPVAYLPRGLDATFASGYVNFKFRNSTGKQLLIRTVVKDKTVTVKLFGTMPDNVSYRTETAELKVNAPKTVYVAGESVAPGGQRVLQQGANGYVVESYLVKTVDGVAAERKRLSRDTYRAQDTLIAVHPDDPRLAPEGGQKPAPESGEGGQPQPPAEDGEIVEPV